MEFKHAAVPTSPATEARSYEQRLRSLVEESAELMAALRAVGSLGLPSWCIGAGVIRSMVWDALHDRPQPSLTTEVDVAYFDANAAPRGRDGDRAVCSTYLCMQKYIKTKPRFNAGLAAWRRPGRPDP